MHEKLIFIIIGFIYLQRHRPSTGFLQSQAAMFVMFEFLRSKKRMSSNKSSIGYWFFSLLYFTNSFVAMSNQSNATSSPLTIMTEGIPSDKSMLSVEPTMMVTTYDGHKLRCTEEEHRRVGCLNGVCFAIDLNPRVAGCACMSGWVGDRCQLKEIPPEFWAASSIIGLVVGLVACVAVVVISLLIFFIRMRKTKQRSHDNSKQEEGAGEEAKSLNEAMTGSRDEPNSSS